jgi:hypothetical protein
VAGANGPSASRDEDENGELEVDGGGIDVVADDVAIKLGADVIAAASLKRR